MNFGTSRASAIENLNRFVDQNLFEYSKLRNFDYGPDNRSNISCLSPYITHGVISELEVIKKSLSKFSFSKNEKFIQEVLWRTYWKGWLELRPNVWTDYLNELKKIREEFKDNQNYRNAIEGNTNIECFNEWIKELKETNYLHNHARMWFASIWIFTLDLPWQLGAEFFMKHLFDGDAASNTLGWRWVAGIQTQGKNYIARESNIRKFTNQRYMNTALNENALPLENPKTYSLKEVKKLHTKQKYKNIVLFESDLNVNGKNFFFENYENVYLLLLKNKSRNVKLDDAVLNFKTTLQEAFASEITNSKIVNEDDIKNLNEGFDVLYPSIGENMDFLNREIKNISKLYFIALREDIFCWQFSKKGFFNFKKNIPEVINYLLHKDDLFN